MSNHSEQIEAIAAALSAAQSEMAGAHKSADNPFYKTKYADLASCIDAAREPLAKNELAVVQMVTGDNVLVTMLTHSSGQWFRSEYKIEPDKPGPQAYGSCLTYGRRYCYAAIVGLAQVDDDGEAATDHKSTTANKGSTVSRADKINEYRKLLEAASKKGTAPLKTAWEKAPLYVREFLGAEKEAWKERAAIVDEGGK